MIDKDKLINKVFHRCRNTNIEYAMTAIKCHFGRLGFKVDTRISKTRSSVHINIVLLQKTGSCREYSVDLVDTSAFKYRRRDEVSSFVFVVNNVETSDYGSTKSKVALEFEGELQRLNDEFYFHKLLFTINYPFMEPDQSDINRNFEPRDELCGMKPLPEDYFHVAVSNTNKSALSIATNNIENLLRTAGFRVECELIDTNCGKDINLTLKNKRIGKWISFEASLSLVLGQDTPIHKSAPNDKYHLWSFQHNDILHKSKDIDNFLKFISDKLDDGTIKQLINQTTFPYGDYSHLSC